MPHRFPVKEIAHQAGLSTATVDRVLNGRPGVRRQTTSRVANAVRELEAQEGQLALSGRKLMIDLLVEAPQAFLDALQDAIARELPLIQSAIFRVRSDIGARFPVDRMVAALDRARKLASDGVIVMSPDAPEVRKAVDRLAQAGIPVVTLATDMPRTARAAYAGLDNRRAGETAAWLIQKWAGSAAPMRVLVTKRNEAFLGEGERERGFRAGMARYWPAAEIDLLVQGLDGKAFADRVAAAVADRHIVAHYSIGGGNREIVRALDRAALRRPAFVVHDLDPENQELLRQGRVDAVLYHDLAEDIRHACQTFLSHHSGGAIPRPADGAALRVMLPPMVPQAGGEG